MPGLTRAQVAGMEQEALLMSERQEDAHEADRWESFASACRQLVIAMDALASLRAINVWRQVEAQLVQGRGREGALVIVLPQGAAAGAGIATFSTAEVLMMRLSESRKAYLGDLALRTFATAAEALARGSHPNGEKTG